MIRRFEYMVRNYPHETFFTFVDEDGSSRSYTYEKTRKCAVALAIHLKQLGVNRRTCVSVDMSNCPTYIFIMLAAVYGGFTIVALNQRLTDIEKDSRIRDLEIGRRTTIAMRLTERKVEKWLEQLLADERYDSFTTRGEGRQQRSRDSQNSGKFPSIFGKKQTTRAAQRDYLESLSQPGNGSRAITPLDRTEIIHFAERSRASYAEDELALIMFTSGTTGRAKAVPLSWRNVCSAAQASNESLNRKSEGCWQLALPLYHIGGFEVVMRSIYNDSPFVLYRRFKPDQVLSDVMRYDVTHISVVDKMLQDMLASDSSGNIRRYSCLLLGGSSFNHATLKKALKAKARVYASYGMTETSSQVAHSLVNESFDGSLKMLPGYEAQIINPDEKGMGQLTVKGPGVFDGYINSRSVHTVDGFFLTGDIASLQNGRILVGERTTDMFVSGGENIYPAEIQDKLLWVPEVNDAYVFGCEDEQWGRRPVAFVERDASVAHLSAQQFAQSVHDALQPRLSKLYQPKHICAVNDFPRTAVGKTDRVQLETLYEHRIEIKQVRLYRIKQPLKAPFVTAKTYMESRESLIVEVVDWRGRTGVAECVSFPTDWYLPETLDQDIEVLARQLIPLVLSQVYLHPSEVSLCFKESAEAQKYPMACAALEPALWDLYGKIVACPLWQLLGGIARPTAGYRIGQSSSSTIVPAGVALGIMPIQETLDVVQQYVNAGYRRVKLKIKPGDDLQRVGAVRRAFPDISLVLDANQSYTDHHAGVFRAFDSMNIACIEEPLAPLPGEERRPGGLFARLAQMQLSMQTPICLDESVTNCDDLRVALNYPELRCFAVKIGKLGGIQPALEFYEEAMKRGLTLWMGGMYETSISKRMHAAFETLPGITLPGDLSETDRYFHQDIASPKLEIDRGCIVLNSKGYESGLGCSLDHTVLQRYLTAQQVFE